MKIFILEDDFSLNKIIKKSLLDYDFMVDSCFDGYEAVDMVLKNKYDLYVLDLNVMGFDGHEVLKHIRETNKEVPVIIISAQVDIDNIKKSYDYGCNDYIKKPFVFEELLLRIEYHLKSFMPQKQKKELVDLGNNLSFDLIKQKLFQFEHEIELSIKEKLLLTLLVRNLNKVVTNEEIHEYVWDSKELEAVSMRSVVHKIKKKLVNGMIVNIRGVGYKLISTI